MTNRIEVDIAVLGAGSAGAAAASFLARDGRSVALLESRPWARGGARWVNDVPPWMFDRARVDRPEAPEKRCDHVPVTLMGASGRARVFVGLRPMWGLDMRALTARLRDDAIRAGVVPLERCRIEHIVETRGRPVEVAVEGRRLGGESGRFLVRARLFVDATGLRQALLRGVSRLSPDCPRLDGTESCIATQQVREVVDRHGALSFVEKHGVGPGHVLSFMGVRGGYSSLMVQLEPDGERVELLAGVVYAGEHINGTQLLREFIREQRWVGRVIFGGAGRIPIRRPYDRLASEGVALLGDAACQTFPAHASGVGSGLVAGRILADAIRPYDDPGSVPATWAYQAAFHRERGGVHAAYDVFRRATQRLRGADLEAMMAAGLIEAVTSRAALNQELPDPGLLDMARMLRGAARMPARASRLVASAVRMPAVRRLYAAYPSEPDERALLVWARAAAVLCGHRAD